MSSVVWTVVMPLKGGAAAKSRLREVVDSDLGALVRAIARDSLEAVLACELVTDVLVVTSDPTTMQDSLEAGATVVPEAEPGSGLPAAVRDGVDAATRRHPHGPCAVLLGDVPALRPHDLAVALEAVATALAPPPTEATAAPRMAFVPDADGTGTVLLAAAAPGDLEAAFGPASAAAHEARGAVRLDLDLPRLRRDVDTIADLAAVGRWGWGRHTTESATKVTFER